MPTIKELKGNPLCRQVSEHWQRESKRLRGTRYNARGERIGTSGPQRVVNDVEVEEIQRETARIQAKPAPVEWRPFDVASLRMMPNKLLLKRPEPQKVFDGIEVDEASWKWPAWFIVVRAPEGSPHTPGEKLLFAKKSKPRLIQLDGLPLHYLGRETAVVGAVED